MKAPPALEIELEGVDVAAVYAAYAVGVFVGGLAVYLLIDWGLQKRLAQAAKLRAHARRIEAELALLNRQLELAATLKPAKC